MNKIAVVLAALPAVSLAQTQVVKPPIAHYWMSVETAAGMAMPGMGAMASTMGGMMGAQASGGRRMLLQLGSQQTAQGEPRAAHEIPPGMDMGAQLPLVTPRREPARRGPEDREMPQQMEKPKGRMLIYWGCGTEVRAGQPAVIDFAGVAEGRTPPGMVSRGVRAPSGPAFGRSRTYGDWPNPEDAKQVPESASLKGDHRVKGNYSPEIRFALSNDFLDKVQLSESGGRFNWKAIPGSTGYFAMLWGGDGDDVLVWTSSELQEMGAGLMDYVPPAEVARLIREKVVMPPQATECAVPAEVVNKAGGSALLQFIAYGEEANFVHPPRPRDPKVPWEQEWAVKVRFKSTASLLLGQQGRQETAREPRRETRQEAPPASAQPDPVKEGIKALRGIFGR